MMREPELLDAMGVPLEPGQRVVYATAGMHATGQLVPGTIVSVRHIADGDEPRERIGIRRDDGRVRDLHRRVETRTRAETGVRGRGLAASATRSAHGALMTPPVQFTRSNNQEMPK